MRELIKELKLNHENIDDIIKNEVIDSDWYEERYLNSALVGVQSAIITELIKDIDHANNLLKSALNEPISKELTQNIMSWIAR